MVWLMPKSVSVPEKTLEHWSSLYIAYRYRTKAALWWPARGEDIDVRRLPPRPGKAVQLELKTTTVTGAGLHEVIVDLGQLWEYRQRPPAHQPFYAFPRPGWRGNLDVAARADGRPVTELAFMRGGRRWWFADWMVVLTAAQVAGVLHKELAAHGSRERDTKKPLVRFDLNQSHSDMGLRAAADPPAIRWLDFWSTLDQCGEPGWPQLIRLPERITPAQGLYRPAQVAGMLRQAANMFATGQRDGTEQLVTLEPGEDGNYQIVPDPR